jgi:MFS family permease
LTAIILVFTFLGFLVQSGTWLGDRLLPIQWALVNWAVTIAAFAILLGVLNVIAVHADRLTGRKPGWFYSAVLILSALVVLIVGLGEIFYYPEDNLWNPGLSPIFVWVLVPLQAAAAALLPFILSYAAFRMLRQGHQKGVFVFLISALVVLIGQSPLPGLNGALGEFRDVWFSWLAIPGLRAVLIGIALGITMTALRLIMGIDRPQS